MEWTAWAASLLVLATAGGSGVVIWGRWDVERVACRNALRSLGHVMGLYLALLDPDLSCDLVRLPIKAWEMALPSFGSLPDATRDEVERAYVALALYNREVYAAAAREPSRTGEQILRDDPGLRRRMDAARLALRAASAALDARVGMGRQRADHPLLEVAPAGHAVPE